MLAERIAKLKKEGYLIFNTNIPDELINNHNCGNEPKKK